MLSLHRTARPRASSLRRRRSQAGFSLMELGIVIAVIGILGFAVIASKGYFAAARRKAAIDLVMTLKSASQQWAMRHRKGLSYGISNSQSIDNVSFGRLAGEGLVSENIRTPWGGGRENNAIIVVPEGAGARCVGFACVRIEVKDVPEDECPDLEEFFTDQSRAISVSCNGGFAVVLR